MLQRKTASKELLELLNLIMKNPLFDGFNLVGGTGLALLIGHRISIDIDLFGEEIIHEDEKINYFKSLGSTKIISKSPNILSVAVNNIKVDIVNYQYPLIDTPYIIESMRIASKKDIAAMKINAIVGRGSKKDFIDLYFLLKEYSLENILNFYNIKYQQGSDFLALKSLTYFDDADREVTPKMLKDFDWNEAKRYITSTVYNYIESKDSQ